MAYYYKQLLTTYEVSQLLKHNCLTDASQGGLIVGPSHEDGGVFMLYLYPEGFRIIGEAEGYEYLVHADASKKFHDQITLMNQPLDEEFSEYKIEDHISIINAKSDYPDIYHSKFIICDFRGGFSIINRRGTKKHLIELEAINRTKFEGQILKYPYL